jgi:hypothetical protein
VLHDFRAALVIPAFEAEGAPNRKQSCRAPSASPHALGRSDAPPDYG